VPYIKQKDKDDISRLYFCPITIDNCGKLNYAFTKLIQSYLSTKGECYQTYNDIVGALECCKQELYDRKIRPYENKKIKENGDVW
jgi:hypothetical protein